MSIYTLKASGNYCLADAYLLCKRSLPNASVDLPLEGSGRKGVIAIALEGDQAIELRVDTSLSRLALSVDIDDVAPFESAAQKAIESAFLAILQETGGVLRRDDDIVNSKATYDYRDRLTPYRLNGLNEVAKLAPFSGAEQMLSDIKRLQKLDMSSLTKMDYADAISREHERGCRYRQWLIPQSIRDSWLDGGQAGTLYLPIPDDVVAGKWSGGAGAISLRSDDGHKVDIFIDTLMPGSASDAFLKSDPSCLNNHVIISIPESVSDKDNDRAQWLRNLTTSLTPTGRDLDAVVMDGIRFLSQEDGYCDIKEANIKDLLSVCSPVITSCNKPRKGASLAIAVSAIENMGEILPLEDGRYTASDVILSSLRSSLQDQYLVDITPDPHGIAFNDMLTIRPLDASAGKDALVDMRFGFEDAEKEDVVKCNGSGMICVSIRSFDEKTVSSIVNALSDTLDAIPVAAAVKNINVKVPKSLDMNM